MLGPKQNYTRKFGLQHPTPRQEGRIDEKKKAKEIKTNRQTCHIAWTAACGDCLFSMN